MEYFVGSLHFVPAGLFEGLKMESSHALIPIVSSGLADTL